MPVINVGSNSQLMAALSKAAAGDTIALAPGNYGGLALNGALMGQAFAKFSGEVTITSADPTKKANFSSFDLDHVSNLTFDGVKFDAVSSSSGGFYPFRMDKSSNIKIENSIFDGVIQDGFGIKQGLRVSLSENITVTNNEFFNFYYGAGFAEVTGLAVSKNDFHHIAFDATQFNQIVDGLIENNRFRDMVSPKQGHRNMIQFWTEGDSAPSSDIVIRGNVISSDNSPAMIQAIFLFNEAVVRNGAGTEMYYRNILIEDNYILGNHPHGIFVGPAIGVTVRDNIVVQDVDNGASRPGWHPQINIDPLSGIVSITGNIANEISNKAVGWIVTGNKLVPIGQIPPMPEPGGSEPPTDGGGGPIVRTGTAGNDALSGTDAADTLRGLAGQDQLTGGGGNDTLFGDAGRDVLRGQSGNDRLVGGADEDILIGGKGADTFVFEAGNTGRDVIRGADGAPAFEGIGGSAGDLIDLSRIDANVLVAGDQAFHFRGGGPGTLSWVEANTCTIVRGNLDGDADFEFVIIIEDGTARMSQYTAADFVL